MADYGFRISIDGTDAKTCSDLDTVVNSKYSTLKGNLSVIGSKNVPEGTDQIVTIAHGLGYIPFVRLFSNMAGQMTAGDYYDSPVFFGDGFGYFVSCTARADATNVYLVFQYYNYGLGGSITYNYKCFISIDKGKL